MELSPQAVAAATFKTVKRGYDPDEVRSYLIEVSASLETSYQQATAMEARARAAIAKLQDAAQQAPAPAADAGMPHEAETISRTLLLAQRTADTAIAEARAQAAAFTAEAESEAAALVERANTTAAQLVDDARDEARRARQDEAATIEGEVQALVARRQALLSEADALDAFVSDQRDRLRAAAATMLQLAEAEPGGLAAAVRPQISAGGLSDAPSPADDAANEEDDTAPIDAPGGDEVQLVAEEVDVADDTTPAEGIRIGGDDTH